MVKHKHTCYNKTIDEAGTREHTRMPTNWNTHENANEFGNKKTHENANGFAIKRHTRTPTNSQQNDTRGRQRKHEKQTGRAHQNRAMLSRMTT